MLVVSTAHAAIAGGQIDWQTYANAADRLLAGQPIYPAAQLHGSYHLEDVVLVGYAYPPPSVVMFLPFADGLLGRWAWLALCLATFWVGMALVTMKYAPPTRWIPALAAMLLTVAAFGPYSDAVWTGNSDLLWAGAFAIAVARPGGWAGPVAGLAFLARTTPGLMALVDWSHGGPRRVVFGAAVAMAFAAATLPIVGVGSWADYIASLSGATPSCDQVVNSLTCALVPVAGIGAAKLIAIAASLCLGLVAISRPWDRANVLLLAIAIVVPLPDLWGHYLLFPFVGLWAVLLMTWSRLSAPASVHVVGLGPLSG